MTFRQIEQPGTEIHPRPRGNYIQTSGDGPAFDLYRIYIEDTWHELLEPERETELIGQVIDGRHAAAILGTDNLTIEKQEHLKEVIVWGQQARDELIRHNLRLVNSIAQKPWYSQFDQAVPLMDRIQAGTLGLIHAIDKFDTDKGKKLSTYATWWIRQMIEREIANTSRTIRLPVHIDDLAKRIKIIQYRYFQSFQQEMTPDELATIIGIDRTEVMKMQQAETVLSTDYYTSDQVDPVGDIVAVEPDFREDNRVQYYLEIQALEALMKSLPKPRDRLIVLLYLNLINQENFNAIWENFALSSLGDPLKQNIRQGLSENPDIYISYDFIGQLLGGLSRERIRQLYNEARAKMLVKIKTNKHLQELFADFLSTSGQNRKYRRTDR
ncbi:hypothetical protein A2154_01850 [Candidatus Gottesmanbacteria bacterium RBG_16_43_7]|uniref:RNA polymerase sigma-70 region 2 domain-containing protein n=1 Tax=Candidatus Gottesmanbacteria bacterium RBG_16_43_7 TaxID=1798373 RepID=A0A1F5ZCR5_9BACT|nr:MAG: hypothetical protein A2154_01850 [Candidatus Gottesmanbacteria bacterium RBG_16_43_7]